MDIGVEFSKALGRRFSVIVETVGEPSAQLVVECARYASPDGRLWASGMAALGTPLPASK